MTHEPGLRPILVVALAIMVVIVPPLAVDLWRFAGREWDYYKFRRLFAGEYDDTLRGDWTSTSSDDLSKRLQRNRDAT